MIFQRYENLQNVNADNMNTFYKGKTQELVGYFPYNPAICSGIGYTSNNYGQVGLSNTFDFVDGLFRFIDQPLPLPTPTTNDYQVFAEFSADTLTIDLGVAPGDQYAVAKLSFTILDNFKIQTSSEILTTTMTLAQIAADPNPEYYLVLFKLELDGSDYIVTIDGNCAWNYNGNDRTKDFPTINNPSADILNFNWTSISKNTTSINPLIVLNDFDPIAYTGQEYITLPNELVIQVFTRLISVPSAKGNYNFPTAFPTTCSHIIGIPHASFANGTDINLGVNAITMGGSATQFEAQVSSTNAAPGNQACHFWAIGY